MQCKNEKMVLNSRLVNEILVKVLYFPSEYCIMKLTAAERRSVRNDIGGIRNGKQQYVKRGKAG